jgi:tetratricopeptide (TPR) repeat protein
MAPHDPCNAGALLFSRRSDVQQDPVDQVFELLSDGNRAEALERLDALLREEPYHGLLFALRALVLAGLGRLDQAADDVARARDLLPDHPFAHYAAGAVALERGDVLQAVHAAQAARQVAPDYADAILLEARARGALGQWERVLTLTAAIAELEPNHEGAALLATIAREHQHDGPLSPGAWKDLAERFPLNAVARAGSGWTRLNAGQAHAARTEFEQALTLDPSLPWAREGLVLALKARNPVYALLLRFFMWFGRLEPRTRTTVLLAGFIGYNVLRRTATAQPELRPFIIPVLVVYVAFLTLTWLADPLLNLLLMAKPEGRRLLDPDERRSAILVGCCLGLSALLGLASLVGPPGLWLSALGLGVSSFAIAAAYGRQGRRRTQLQALAAVAAISGLASGIVPAAQAGVCLLVTVLAVAAATWLSYFGSDRPSAS